MQVQKLGDPFTLTKCPACNSELTGVSKNLKDSWTDVLKVFVAVEKGDKEKAMKAPFILAKFLKMSDGLLGVKQPWVSYHFAKGLFCRSMKIVRGLARERKLLAEANALRDT